MNLRRFIKTMFIVLVFVMMSTVAVQASCTSTSVTFDSNYYSSKYKDLKNAFGTNSTALKNHFENNGVKEGRQGSAYFNVKYYLSKYSDLKKAFGNDYEAAYNHFITYGIKEGRQGSANFDVKHYVAKYSDLKKAFGTDYAAAYNHYVNYGVKEKRTATATSHVYGKATVTKNATCTEEGEKTSKCTVCGAKKTETVPVKHTYKETVLTEPTCDTKGTAVKVCTICGDVKDKDEAKGITGIYELPATQHNYSAEAVYTKKATCAKAGYSLKICSKCGGSLNTPIPALDHKTSTGATALEFVAENEATCTTAGNIAYYRCTNEGCGKYFSDSEAKSEISDKTSVAVAALAHKIDNVSQIEQVEAVNAKCTTGGHQAYYQCKKCNAYFSDSEGNNSIADITTKDIDPLDHDYSGNKVDATTDADGYTKCVRYDDCGSTQKIHGNLVYLDTPTGATCEQAGTKRYICSNCGDIVEEEITKLTHNMSTSQTETDPTCTTDGNYAYWYCDICQKYYKDENGNSEYENQATTVRPAAHTLNHYDAVPATCLQAGTVEYWSCSGNCNKNYADENGTQALENTVDPQKQHNMEHKEANDATCLTAGNLEYWYCDQCQKYYKDENGNSEYENQATTVVAATGHSFGEQIQTSDATCTTAGVSQAHYYCSKCNKNFENSNTNTTNEITGDTVTPATGHSQMVYTAAEPATCTEDGVLENWYCDKCQKNYSDAEGSISKVLESIVDPAKGHDTLVQTAAKAATCGEAGTNGYWTCPRENCGAVFSQNDTTTDTYKTTVKAQEIPATDEHTDSDELNYVAKQATCTEKGIKTLLCKVCEQTYTEDIPAGHDYEAVFTWSEDYQSATAKLVCKRDNTHIEEITEQVTVETTSTTDESKTITATVTHNNKEYTDPKTVPVANE